MSQIKIGVIIPSFNDPRIVHSILSIRHRDTCGITKIYVIDGGSSAECLSMIQKHLRAQDYLLSGKDRGIFDALNKGLDVVQEDIVTWLGSDDFITRNVDFRYLVDTFEQEKLDCFVFDTVFVDEIKTRRRTAAAAPTVLNCRMGRHVQHFASYWRRSRIGAYRFDLSYQFASDQDFFVRLALSGPIRTKLDNSVGTIARLGGASSASVRRIFEANLECFRIFRKYFGTLGGAFATICKMLRKSEYLLVKARYPVVGELTELLISIF